MSCSIRAAQLVALVAVCLCAFVPVAFPHNCARQMNIVDYPLPGHHPIDQSVAAADGYAYVVGCDSHSDEIRPGRLRVIDVRTPSSPVEVGMLELMCAVNIVLSGHYAYVDQWDESGFAHVSVIDIGDPSHPIEKGSVSGVGSFEAVSNGYAYAVDSEGLWVLELTDPTSPSEVGFLAPDLGYTFTSVAVSGTHAYVTSRNSEYTGYLHVVDVSDPETPFYVASVQVSDWPAQGVEVSHDHAYVASRSGNVYHGEVTVVDVSDPEAPVVSTRIDNGRVPTQVEVSSRLLYVIYWAGDGTSVIDVFDAREPSQPYETGMWEEALFRFGDEQGLLPLSEVRGMSVRGRHVYVVGYPDLLVFDNRGCLYHEMPQEWPVAIQ